MIKARFAEFALHVVFFRKAKAAMGLDAGIRGLKRSICRKHLGHIGLCARVRSGLEKPDCFFDHEIGGAHVGVGLRNGELDPLILPYGAIKDAAILCVRHRYL